MSDKQRSNEVDETLYQSVILNIFQQIEEISDCDELMSMQDVMDITGQYGLNDRLLVTKVLINNGYKTKVFDGTPIWVMRCK